MSYRYIGTVDFGIDFEEIRERNKREAQFYASLSPRELETMRKREEIECYLKEIYELESALNYGVNIDTFYVRNEIRRLENKIRKLELNLY